MATGDLTNNIRKMRSRLREIKYMEEFDVNLIAEGQPAAYLPIYHAVFTSYSQPLGQLILDKGIELFGKSDARFMEAVYKILRDIFAYKPPVTKEQFFAKGFAERKVIMCTEIIQLVKKKHTQLNPAPPKTCLKTSVRPKSAPETRHLPLAVPKTKQDSSKVSPRNLSRNVQRHVPQVVNELTSMPASEPVRHLSSSASHPHPARHVAGHDSLDSSESSDPSESVPRSILSGHEGRLQSVTKHVSIQSPRETKQTSAGHNMPQSVWKFEDTPDKLNPVKSHFMTPSIKKVCMKSVEVVSMPKGQYDDRDEDTSIVEIRAPTSDSVLQSPVPTSSIDIASLYETVETLTGQVMQLAQNQQVAGNVGADKQMETVLSKIENLTARILLLENRMSIIEANMGEVQLTTSPATSLSTPAAVGSQSGIQLPPVQSPLQEVTQPWVLNGKHVNLERGDISVDSPGLFSGPGNSFAEELKTMSDSQKARVKGSTDFSLNYSPIRRVNNGLAGTIMSANEDTFAMETEDDARRSSTPTFGGSLQGDSSLHCDFSHLETKDTVSRIHNMMKETTQMMKVKEAADMLQAPEVDIGS